MATERETTTEQVLNHMKKGWGLSKMDAMKRFGTVSLHDIIFRLRKKHIIDTVMVKSRNGGEHAEYHWRGAREPETGSSELERQKREYEATRFK